MQSVEKVKTCQSNVGKIPMHLHRGLSRPQESRTTARSSGHANYASQESTALEELTHLVKAATSDRTTIANLTSQVEHLQE